MVNSNRGFSRACQDCRRCAKSFSNESFVYLAAGRTETVRLFIALPELIGSKTVPVVRVD